VNEFRDLYVYQCRIYICEILLRGQEQISGRYSMVLTSV